MYPYFLQIEKDDKNLPAPFKFNSHSLQDEEFPALVKVEWKTFGPQVEEIAMFQFYSNLQRVKKATMAWWKEKYKASQKYIIEEEEKISDLLENHKWPFLWK